MTMKQTTTIIFDVDDTLYDVGTGFTAHRNGDAVQTFMVEKFNFPSLEAAKAVRDEYFLQYHATAKALTVAQQEGKFPEGSSLFEARELSEWWAANLKFQLLGGPKSDEFQKDLRECPLQLVAFSNGPRKYVKRVLQELQLWELFGESKLFAVDDVLPSCKPEKEAFQKVFDAVGVEAEECIMVEDSMKNIRRAKELGMKTILVRGKQGATAEAAAASSEATKPGDAPQVADPAVDAVLDTIEQLRDVLPGLWETPTVFTKK